MKQFLVKDLGKQSFRETWDLQEKLLARAVDAKIRGRKGEDIAKPDNHFLFVEHPHVYTLGKSGTEDHLLIDKETLEREGIDYFKINRGGDITYHGPGQVVGYPILDLEQFFTDIHRYLRTLEEAIIRTISEHGIEGDRIEGLTGVWIDVGSSDPRKIAALGVKCSRWVTMHGFALNVNTDLSYFEKIVPCGIDDKAVTSMQKELGKPVDMEAVKRRLLYHLGELFEAEILS